MEHVYGEQRPYVGYPYSTPQVHAQSIYPGSQEQAYFPGVAPQTGVPLAPCQFPPSAQDVSAPPNVSVTRVVIPAEKSGSKPIAFPLAMPVELDQSRAKIIPSAYEGHIKAINSILAKKPPVTYILVLCVAVIALIAGVVVAVISELHILAALMVSVLLYTIGPVRYRVYSSDTRAAISYCDGLRENGIRWSFQCTTEDVEENDATNYYLVIEFNWHMRPEEEQHFGIQQAYGQPMNANPNPSTEPQYAGVTSQAAMPYQADCSAPKNEPSDRVIIPAVESMSISFPLAMPLELEQSISKITPSAYADHIKAINSISAKGSRVTNIVFTFGVIALIPATIASDITGRSIFAACAATVIVFINLAASYCSRNYAIRKATSYCEVLQKSGMRWSLQSTTQCTVYGADHGPDENTKKYFKKYILVVELN